jgi:hypothetical protein
MPFFYVILHALKLWKKKLKKKKEEAEKEKHEL